MSQQITEAFVQQFADNFRHLAQQMTSRFEPHVTIEPNIVGMSKSVNRLGQRTASRRTQRHADTPINDQPHSTRFVDLFDWDDGDMIDDQDKIRMLVDPTSEYVKAMVSSLNRAKDDVIIDAFGGVSRATTGGILLPAVQKIAVGGTGLTKAKIIQARKMFRKNEADNHNGEELYITYTADSAAAILADPTLTSQDYMAGKFLQDGDIEGKWMGFNWIPSERTPYDGATRRLYAWAKSGVTLGKGADITTKVGEDPGKGFNVRIYAKMSIGAVRVEEEKVVEISVAEAA
ncbi:phage capsid protein [Pseudomonas alliivorans]|nr:phage capsid protein [Pseudomonas alliivorans]MEE4688821.1 phage capsid protein [Pseudomonas alliivorans]MEE4710185.1 phage capsid protein [Pseudomonas alliivorans]MEE4725208.1 phage capsid protein [Pseudomonas alliivorans]MEE4765931.1 phage capsid protein [Pseudomonas alliivorans]